MALGHTLLPILPTVESRLIGNSVLVLFTALVVALRIVARLVTGSRLGWDDYLILAAVPQGSTSGAGYAHTEISEENISYIAMILIPFGIIYNLSIVTAKLSVLFFYLRVFTGTVLIRRLTKGMVVLVGIWGIANLIQSLLVCRIHDGRVDFQAPAKCQDNARSYISTGLFNCTTNLVISLLPLYTIWSLRTVCISTRLGLTGVFLFSVNVTWVSILRIVHLYQSVGASEPLIDMAEITFLAVLEVNLSILCNSLPMLLPLYSYWRYRRFYDHMEDEYVSRVRGVTGRNDQFLVEDVTNGLPLEIIYGKRNVHFEATIGADRRDSREYSKARFKPNLMSRSRTLRARSGDDGDTESTRRLSRNAGATGIKIETYWTVTEETKDETGTNV